MVIVVALSSADRPPAANIALGNGVRIGGKFGGAIDRCLKPPLHKPVVGKEVAKTQRLEIFTRQDHMHSLRQISWISPTMRSKDRAAKWCRRGCHGRAWRPELRRTSPKPATPVYSLQEIGAAIPVPVLSAA